MQMTWFSPTEFVSGDPTLTISYPFTMHPGTVITSTVTGDSKWISMGLRLTAGARIEEITVCYQVHASGATVPGSSIAQVRVIEMTTPEKALVRHDQFTELKSTTPECFTSIVGAVVPGGACTLQLRLDFRDLKDWISLGAVAVKTQSNDAECMSVKAFGAKGDATTDDTAAINAATAVGNTVCFPVGVYRISSNVTANVDLVFQGGVLSIDSGAILTINGCITASSTIIFAGPGIVVIEKNEIDLAWFTGDTCNAKWDFCRRGITAVSNKTIVIRQPSPADAHAVTTMSGIFGAIKKEDDVSYGTMWKVSAPLLLEQRHSGLTFLTYGGFAATAAIKGVFVVGSATAKADLFKFPLTVHCFGNAGMASSVFRFEGCGHCVINYIEAREVGSVVEFVPQNPSTCNDIKIGSIYCAFLYNRAVVIDGSTGSNSSVTDCEIGFLNCDGFMADSKVDCLVYIRGTVTGFRIGKTTLRGLGALKKPKLVDATTATVLVENTVEHAPGLLLEIGSILNGSQPAKAKALVVRDASGFKGPKIGGLVLAGGAVSADTPKWPAIDIDYTVGAQIHAYPASHISIGPHAEDTFVSGARMGLLLDSGTGTRVSQGLLRRAIELPADKADIISIPGDVTNPYLVSITPRDVGSALDMGLAANALSGMFYSRSYVRIGSNVLFAGETLNVMSGKLSGTTGPAGKLNVGPWIGEFYIENRTKETVAIIVVIIIDA